MTNWHVNTEKEEAKKQERKAKERLKALKYFLHPIVIFLFLFSRSHSFLLLSSTEQG